MNGLFRDTFVELFDRKVIWVYLVFTLLALIFIIFAGNVKLNFEEMGQSNAQELEDIGIVLSDYLLNYISALFSFLIIITIILTAGTVPNMFIKGRADFYLSKPLSRKSLLLKKFISVFSVYGGLMVVSSAVVYLTGIIVFGGFDLNIFVVILFALGSFFVWLIFSFFFGLFFGRTVSTVVSVVIFWVIQKLLSYYHWNRELVDMFDAKITKKVLDTMYLILPKMTDFGDFGDSLAGGKHPDNYVVVYSTLAFAVVALFLTLSYFNKKNY